jgi:hypothetical protein
MPATTGDALGIAPPSFGASADGAAGGSAGPAGQGAFAVAGAGTSAGREDAGGPHAKSNAIPGSKARTQTVRVIEKEHTRGGPRAGRGLRPARPGRGARPRRRRSASPEGQRPRAAPRAASSAWVRGGAGEAPRCARRRTARRRGRGRRRPARWRAGGAPAHEGSAPGREQRAGFGGGACSRSTTRVPHRGAERDGGELGGHRACPSRRRRPGFFPRARCPVRRARRGLGVGRRSDITRHNRSK